MPAATAQTGLESDADPLHMRRAVAFSRSIKDSTAFVEKFAQIIAPYRETHPDAKNLLHCDLDHVDSTFDALKRNARLDWLKAETPENTCRIRNDPNDWAHEHHQPRYIIDLLKRIVRVSLETMKIVNALAALNERK